MRDFREAGEVEEGEAMTGSTVFDSPRLTLERHKHHLKSLRRNVRENAPPMTAQGSLQIGGGCGGGAGWASRYRARIGSNDSFGQNLGAPMSFRHAAFQ